MFVLHLMISIVLIAQPVFAATYFVKATGNNAQNGLSDATAWKTIAKVNAMSFAPGDAVQFRGGDTFTGTLALNGSNDTGSWTNPITIQSYGTGRALISNAKARCMTLTNIGHVHVTNINCSGVNFSTNGAHGIMVWNDAGLVEDLEFSDMDVGQFGYQGIYVGTGTYASAYNSLKFMRMRVHDNLYDGIGFAPQGNQLSAFRNLYLGNVEADHNRGFGDGTGNGVEIYGAENLLVENSQFHDNGGFNNNSGNYGIYVQNTSHCTMRWNEAYNQKTSQWDGGGFDLDGGTVDCILEHNYSHDNDGPGYSLIEVAGSPQTWGYNILRNDNSSVHDGCKFGLGSLYVTQTGMPWTPISNLTVTGNRFYATCAAGKAVNIRENSIVGNGVLSSNLFYANVGALIVNVETYNPGLSFVSNTYQHDGTWGGTWTIIDNGVWFSTLASWGRDQAGASMGE